MLQCLLVNAMLYEQYFTICEIKSVAVSRINILPKFRSLDIIHLYYQNQFELTFYTDVFG